MTDTYTTITEFTPRTEAVTASIDVQLFTGERFTSPISVGFYHNDDSHELWIEQEGHRVQFHVEVLQAVVKQMRRAAQIAKESSNN